MSNNYQVADILYFEKYCFTDTGGIASHFALVTLPSYALRFPGSSKRLYNNLLCAVITSQKPRSFYLLLLCRKYSFFSKPSYACFDRMDINCVDDLDSKHNQPLGSLDKPDVAKSLKAIRSVLYGSPKFNDPYMRGSIIREWKKKRDNLP